MLRIAIYGFMHQRIIKQRLLACETSGSRAILKPAELVKLMDLSKIVTFVKLVNGVRPVKLLMELVKVVLKTSVCRKTA